jgi:hypothetical protein
MPNHSQFSTDRTYPGYRRVLIGLLSSALWVTAWPQNLLAYQAPQAPSDPARPDQATQARAPTPQAPSAPRHMQQTSEQLQQLVAPIALYPDSLVAQILAASTFPEQVVEADRWVIAHPDSKADALGHAVDHQPWDPSIKALAAFPSVLGNMDKNLSWTSSLGDAYYNQQQDVMDAVQEMRRRAEQAGNLKNESRQTIKKEHSNIVIEPAIPEIVYVPAYDPWLVYGDPIVAWPGWYPYPGIWYDGPFLSWGIGFEIGWFGGWEWGWGHWGFDWRHHYVTYDHGRYYSRSTTFYNRNNFYRGGVSGRETFNRGDAGRRAGPDRSGQSFRSFNGDGRGARGYAEPRGESSIRSGAFDGYQRGGESRGFSSRGSSSFGGGGFGGGGHGGGGFGGGGHAGGGGHR